MKWDENGRSLFFTPNFTLFFPNFCKKVSSIVEGAANIAAIHVRMVNFPRSQHFSHNPEVHWQAKTFNEILLNMSNLIPNEVKKIILRDPPWITNSLKRMLKRKNRRHVFLFISIYFISITSLIFG